MLMVLELDPQELMELYLEYFELKNWQKNLSQSLAMKIKVEILHRSVMLLML
jgi:hypothetical protein